MSRTSRDLATILESVLPALVASLAEHRAEIRSIVRAVEREGERGGIGGVIVLADTVADELDRKPLVLFDTEVQLFPPSVKFGKGDDTVVVGPTVGGSGSPDGKASIGVQVDVNPKGEGKSFIGSGNVSVDVDSEGKAKGISIGWKCKF